MRYAEACEARVSRVGLGTWQFGSAEWAYGRAYERETAPQIVRRSLDLGVTLFDTAEIYGFGRSERVLGAALAARRDDAFVATKLFPLVPCDPVVHWRARGSLRRLGTESVDLYQLHWPNPVVPLRLTMDALARLVSEGMVHHVGVSNFPLARWREAERVLGGPVLANQVRYSLLDRQAEHDLLPWAQSEGRLVIAYSPLAQGLLSGRYGVGNRPSGMRASMPAFQPENVRRLEPVVRVLRQVAAAHGASCAQVALAWLLRRPNVVVIPGASSVEQAESNARAAEIDLTEDEDALLCAASDAYRPLSGATVLAKAARGRGRRTARRVRRTARRVGRTVEGLRG